LNFIAALVSLPYNGAQPMSLQIGQQLGSYEIMSLIGKGGMGEVYRARDSKLKREVAIKVLPEEFSRDHDRLNRFQREAEVLASLNHSNIASIYDLQEANGARFLIMELVEGETLAERITRGPLPIEEALDIAKQICDALEAAHEKSIIHRDLKPGNVKILPDGKIKVLDFGLAKALEASSANAALSNSPTISMAATTIGVILGTAAYMSPEQAKGRIVDKRSDIFAFGCVLYEMMTGRQAFEGDDVPEVLGAILKIDPDWSRLPAGTPAAVHRLLRRVLKKDVRQRLGDIHDARIEIEEVGPVTEGSSTSAPISTPTAPPHWRRVVMLIMGGLLIGAVIASAAVWVVMRKSPPRVTRTTINTPEADGLNFQSADRDVAVTPDGTRVVYRGRGQILVRALDQLNPTPLTGLGAPHGLFVSPDGQWVGFFDGNALKKVAITGGPAVTVTTLGDAARGATWGEDGTIVFATRDISIGLQRVPVSGGDPAVLTKPNRQGGEFDHVWPEFLPGGQAVLFTIVGMGVENNQIAVLDLRSGTTKVLIRGGSDAHYVASGHLVYGVADTLRAVAFDLRHLEVMGSPVPVVPQLRMGTGAAEFDVAGNGT
jgi:eukaryotic-like serine/threonine-protein kinase